MRVACIACETGSVVDAAHPFSSNAGKYAVRRHPFSRPSTSSGSELNELNHELNAPATPLGPALVVVGGEAAGLLSVPSAEDEALLQELKKTVSELDLKDPPKE